MSVGENIRRMREKEGITQVYLAEQAGISQAMLCQIERGTKNPSLQVGKEIANILGCGLDCLLAEKNGWHEGWRNFSEGKIMNGTTRNSQSERR